MKRTVIYTRLLTIFCFIILSACTEIELLPQNVTATARLLGTDGLGEEVEPVTLQLIHVPAGEPTARVTSINQGPQNLTQIDLLIERTGIPIGETYYFLQISQGTIHPEGNDPNTGIAGPNPNWYVHQNIGDLGDLRVRTDLLDSPLSSQFSNFPAPIPVPGSELTPIRTAGSSFLIRVEEDDVSIPFTAPAQLIDMRRLITQLFNGLRQAIVAGIGDDSRIALGGQNSDGDFRMYFVPHVTHSGLLESGRNVKGVGFIVAFSVTVLDPALNFVPIGTAHVFMPISLLFEPEDTNYRIAMDPFSFISGGLYQPENLDRITVYANSLLAGFTNSYIAGEVRTGMINALTNLPDEELEVIDLQLEILALGINSYLDNDRTIPENFDVILLLQRPVDENTVRNRVVPFTDEVQLRLVILE